MSFVDMGEQRGFIIIIFFFPGAYTVISLFREEKKNR